ncbi:MAG: sigma-70 family RNA polymerase sigma factor [Oscillospiraceae bacterium]|nr:sigma-70 family RNA polymerase sigma factor [Oscillospiraceae bacterium]
MNKRDADFIIGEYVQKLYGFALNKLGNPDEAEELSARIIAEVYEVLVKRENIVNLNGYIYKIAHNVWTRYIGRKSKSRSIESFCGFDSTDGLEHIPDEKDFAEEFQQTEQYGIIRREIAYLSKIQREIVVRHYYDREKVKTIAAAMNLPEGTVKWHLSCTRKELMIGMDKIRTIGNLGLQPIRFSSMGHNGHPGTKGDTQDFLAKVVTQNIAYAAYHKPRTINEIAEELGVNPIFVEDEVAVLEEYGYMDKLDSGKYRTNIQISIPSDERNNIYTEAPKKYTELFAEKFVIPYLESIKEIPDFLTVPDNDINLLKWSMIPPITDKLATADINDMKYSVKRKDGGDFVAHAALDVPTPKSENPKESIYWACGSMWRNPEMPDKPFSWDQDYPWKSWRLDVYWGSREGWRENRSEDYDKLYYFMKGELAENEANVYAYKRLLDRGYLVKTDSGYKVNIILSKNMSKWFELFPKPNDEILALSKEYAEKIAEADILNQPEHMHEQIRYYDQNAACTLHTHIMEYLLDKGVLKLPTEEQRKGLCTVMFLGE